MYFFDTYAFFEIYYGNENYRKYEEVQFTTTIFNLYELYYNLLKDFGEDLALEAFNKHLPLVIEIKKEHIILASKFRLHNTKKKFSYGDALGYAVAKLEGLKFLTGDKEFENLPNVEFVK